MSRAKRRLVTFLMSGLLLGSAGLPACGGSERRPAQPPPAAPPAAPQFAPYPVAPAAAPLPPNQYTYAPGTTPLPGFNPLFLPPPLLPWPEFALGIFRPPNARALAALAASPASSRCAPFEVAPGKWVTLDCNPQPPVTRARRFVAPRGLREAVLPLMVDHRVDRLEGPVKDQGAAGTCTAFALSSAMDNAVRRLGKQEVMAPLHVWSRYRVPEMGRAGDSNLNHGIASEALWPYDPVKACRMAKERISSCESAYGVGANSSDRALEAEATRADSQGHFTLSSVESLQSRPGDPQEVAAIIAGGDSVWVAFQVNRRSWQLFGGDNVVDDYQSVEDGGHAVVLSGYRTQNGLKQFLIHNSWGPQWGDNGYGWISENMVRDHLIYAYRVRVTEGDGSAPAAPAPDAPTPPPSGNGCPAGQVRDQVYGNCAAPCASGSAPSAGFCLPQLPGFPFPLGLPTAPGAAPPPVAPPPPGASPAPGPAPAPPSTAGCPAGQAPDVFTRQCANFCPNGLPPIGGFCLPR